MSKEEVSSPTVTPEAVLLTSVVEAAERRFVVSMDVPNAFIQAGVDPVKDGDPRITMKMTGELVDVLLKLDYELYSPYVVMEKGKKVIYMVVERAIYGMIISPMLWYKKLRGDLENQGFVVNPCDPCVANKKVNGKMLTVCWHVDDLKASHVEEDVVEEFVAWVVKNYSDENGTVTVCRGKIHPFLAIVIDYSEDGILKIDMTKYVGEVLADFQQVQDIGAGSDCPWTEKLFYVDNNSPKLSEESSETFHTYVAKLLFLCTRARPDIQPAVAFMCSRVQEPTQQDWRKLLRVMKFLKETKDVVLTIEVENMANINWYLDASFAVHQDYKSHTGGTMNMGKGSILSKSTKQKLNTRSSTEAELVAVDDGMSVMLWTKLFLEAQGIEIKDNVLHQDNKSAILLEKNGKASSSKRTRHLNIRYFFIKDQIDVGNIIVVYCPTDDMLGDYFTKPKTGKAFKKLWNLIMNYRRKRIADGS